MTSSVGARKRLAALCALVALLAVAPSAAANIATRPLLTWQTNGRVNAIMQVGGVTYVGGKFTQVSSHNGATTAAVSNLAAFDTNGNFTNWAPVTNGTVKAFATDGSGAIIAGGSFTKVNGAGRPHVAEILANGTLVSKTTWAATADGDVQALATAGSTLYMGGQFATVDGQPRAFLGAVSLTDGTIDSSWQPFVDGRVDGLETVAGNVIAGGFFLNAGSAAGGHASLAEFDGTTGAFVSNYTGHTSSAVVSMAEGGDGSIYTGHSNNRMQRFTPTGASGWQIGFDGNVQAITLSDGAVIAGGHFQNLCDVGTNCANPIARHHIAALDPTTGGLDTAWAPSVNSDLGVFALADTSLGLAAGGDFTTFGGLAQAHLAFLQTGSSVPIDSTPPTIAVTPDAILRKATTVTGGAVPLLVRFTATDPSSVCATHLQRSTNGAAFTAVPLPTKTALSKPATLVPSANTYRYQASAADCIGNASAFVKGPSVRLTAFQDANAGIAYTAAWARAGAPKAYGGTIHTASKAGSYAKFRFTGRQVAWVASRTATRGSARVYLDGHLTATVNLHNASAAHRRIVFAHAWSGDGVHTIKVVCAGTPGHPTIDVDAFLTVR